MKYTIVGAGAMGCLYGAALKEAGKDVCMIASGKGTMEAIQKHGIIVHKNGAKKSYSLPVYYARDYHKKADVIFLFTKGFQTEDALRSVEKNISGDSILISLQNGIGHIDIMKKYVDEDHLIIGTSNFPSDRSDYGVISCQGEGVSRIHMASERINETLMEIYQDLKEAGMNPEIPDSIYAAIWEKLAFNAALNSVTAVLKMPQGYIGQREYGRKLFHQVARESCRVARAKKIPVDESRVISTIDHLLVAHFDHCPSMLQDILSRRKTEIDSINGAIVREAKKASIEVPVTQTLYYLVSILENQ